MARILVVEDDPASRELLVALLTPDGHEVIEASTGEQAVELAGTSAPDLVLLDVILPGMHGFEVAFRIKSQVVEDFLPIVLLTSLIDNTSRMMGLRKGADDFLSKPVNGIELKIRIDHLLSLREQGRTLRRNNIELLEASRYREEMVNMIVHDLKNPLSVVLANLDYIGVTSNTLTQPTIEALHDSQIAAHRLLRLIANLLDVARAETKRLHLRRTQIDLSALLAALTSQRAIVAQGRGFSIDANVGAGLMVAIDADLVTRLLENLFDNAVRYTPRGGQMSVRVTNLGDRVKIEIGNSGPAIPPSVSAVIFDKYGQSEEGSHGRMNLGLGLYFCRLAAEAHGGKIWVEQTPTYPTVFAVELPISA